MKKIRLNVFTAWLILVLTQACTLFGPDDGYIDIDSPINIEETEASARARRNMQEPAVVALVEKSRNDEAAGNLDSAAANLERALRINPKSARLWNRLAHLRLRQERYKQAAELAFKSNTLARSERTLQASNWRIIYKVRQNLGDMIGAKEALAKAEAFEH